MEHVINLGFVGRNARMKSFFGTGEWGQRQQVKRAMVAALQQSVAPQQPMLLGYYPAVTQNPFQALLYRQASQHGAVAMPLPRLAMPDMDFDDISPVVHLHWIHGLISGEAARSSLKRSMRALRDNLQQMKDAGVKIVWTVHNSLSHKVADVAAEVALRQMMADMADMLHLMNPASLDICAQHGYYLDPGKVFISPHPSLLDAYPHYVEQANARLNFDMLPGQPLFLLFGRLQRQKGISRMIDAFIDAQQRHFGGEARLIIAGTPAEPDFVTQIAERAKRPDIRLIAERIPDGELQYYFTAADVVTCPYESSLNSGVAITALGFGRHLLAPTALRAIFGEQDAVTYVEEIDCTHLADRLHLAYQRACQPGSKKAADLWGREHESRIISDAFFTNLRQKLGQQLNQQQAAG